MLHLVLAFSVAIAAVDTPTPTTLPVGRTQAELETYTSRLVPQFNIPTEATLWHRQAERIRQRVLSEVVLRGVPESWLTGPIRVVWGETIPREGYVIRKLRYEAVPGLWIGALLYEPTNLDGKVPGVLNTNGHVGKPGMTIDYKQIRCINLAKRGMLALSTEFIGMGQLQGSGYGHNESAHLDLCGRAGVSVFYLALKRALDILCSHEAIDLERVAVTGLSGGGWQTIVLSALDERVRLAAPNAGYIGIAERIRNTRDIGDIEQMPTDLATVADYVHLTALLAPRPALLIYNEKDDCCFTAGRARESVFEPIVPLYTLLGADNSFAFHVNTDPGTHNYLLDNRQSFYRFLNRHFIPPSERIDEEIPSDDEILPAEALAVEYPDRNEDFHTLAEKAMASLPKDPAPIGGSEESRQWSGRVRPRLRRIVRPDPKLPVAASRMTTSQPTDSNEPTVHLYTLTLGNGVWTLPVTEYRNEDSHSAGTAVIVADGGHKTARDVALKASAAHRRVVVVDLLLTGECQPTSGSNAQWAMTISCLGKRALGIQASQLDSVLDWVATGGNTSRPIHLITQGRMSGLAALASSALTPDRAVSIELHEMHKSLKSLISDRVPYKHASSMFCFGLLEVADVPDLIRLAEPTPIEMKP